MISANSFWIRLVDVPSALLIFGFVLGSGFESLVDATPPAPTGAAVVPAEATTELVRLRPVPLVPLAPVLGPAVADIAFSFFFV